MISHTTAQFRQQYKKLPLTVKRQARNAFQLWMKDPRHSSLRFKKVHRSRPIYSVRIGLGWRALAVREGEHVIWFWVGSHADYEKVLKSL